MRRYGVYGRSLNKFQITQRREVQAEVLKGIRCLIDQQDVFSKYDQCRRGQEKVLLHTKKDIKPMDLDICLRVNRVRKS